jgi:hypothetical protein
MAILFTKDIREDKLLNAYNNNIIRFKSDSTLIPTTALIIGIGFSATIYPHPNGTFYFNFRDYVAPIINQKKFKDDLNYNFTISTNQNDFKFDVTTGCYISGLITIIINFTNNTQETITRNLKFLTSVEQIDTFKENEILLQAGAANVVQFLTPVKSRNEKIVYLKYWEGYPFEFSFFTTQNGIVKFQKDINSISLTIASRVTSLFLTDGFNNIEGLLPLQNGFNSLQVFNDNINQNIDFKIEKITDCNDGIYIKFLNKYGRWNYWLLNKFFYKTISSKYLSEINNDFENLEDTISPNIQIGKVSDSALKCVAKKINETEKLILKDIIHSPKILLFKGVKNTMASNLDWIDVKLKTSNFQIIEPNKKQYNFYLEFDLPSINTITL